MGDLARCDLDDPDPSRSLPIGVTITVAAAVLTRPASNIQDPSTSIRLRSGQAFRRPKGVESARDDGGEGPLFLLTFPGAIRKGRYTLRIAFWQLLMLVFVGALLDSPGVSARRSLFPDLVEENSMSLDRANALYTVTWRVASLIGAPAAGILIAVIGARNLLFVATAGFAIAAMIFATLIPEPERETVEAASGNVATGMSRYWADVREGFSILKRDGVIFWLFLSFSVGSLLAEPLYVVILQIYVIDTYGTAEKLVYILASLAIGSLPGNAIYATLSDRLPRRGYCWAGSRSRRWHSLYLPLSRRGG